MTGPTFAKPSAPPAPAPGGAPKPPAPTRPAKPPAPPDEGGGLRVLTYLRLHWLMIAFCGTLLGAAGAFAAWDLLASKYESYSMLRVSSVSASIGKNGNPNEGRTDFTTYARTIAQLIKSEFVLNAALRDLKDVATIQNQKDPIQFLTEEVQVNWSDGSEVIRITFKGHEPQDARRIVDAVQKAFLSEVIQTEVREKQAFLRKVEDEQGRMKGVLTGISKPADKPGAPGAAPGAKAEPAPPGTLPSEIVTRINPSFLLNRWMDYQRRVEELPLSIDESKRRILVLQKRLDELQKSPVPDAMWEMVDKDPEVVAEKIQKNAARRKYETWLNAGDPNNPAPGVLDLKALYEQQDKTWQATRQKKLDALMSLNRTREAAVIGAELEKEFATELRLKEQLKHAETLLAQTAAQVQAMPLPPERTAAGGILPARYDRAPYTPEETYLGGTDSIFRRLIEQYHLIRLELSSPPRVTELQAASQPTQKDTKKQIIGTSFAGVMGFVVMAMGVIGYETVSRRVSSLADVRAAVSAPVVGVIPCPPDGAVERDPVKRAAANEAIDKLRAYVSQTWLSRGATSIAVTSPIAEEGKALTAFGLASSLAQAGYRTLLVDFDLREPALHAFAGVPNLAGVCELLRGETDARSAIQFLPSGLHLLPAGKWSDEARKAATGERLEGVLAKLKEPYDCVVIHGHALLTVAESVEVARRCEVVLVCARYRETATPLLKRAAERVAALEIPYTGVVYVGATDQEALC
jgi:Mrp family chromosome partitioning ATPase